MTCLLRAEQELGFKSLPEAKRIQLRNQTGIFLHEIFTSFRASQYLPLTGPIPWKVKVDETEIELHISAILKTNKSSTLHIIDFSPYSEIHSMRNDLVEWMKVKSCGAVVDKHLLGPKAVIHCFGITRDKLIYSSMDDKFVPKDFERRCSQVVGLLPHVDYPVLPCRLDCPHKLECYMDKQ